MTINKVTLPVLLLLAGTGLGAWLSLGGEPGSPSISILEQSNTSTVFEVAVPGIEVRTVATDEGEFSALELPGQVMAHIGEGRPQVPKVAVLLAIPSGASVTAQAQVLESRTVPMRNVYPLQPPLLEGQKPGPLVFDRKFYEADVKYPGLDLKVVETGVWRDLHVANLQVYPIQVNPGRAEVQVATRVRVEVRYSGGSYPRTVAAWMLPHYASFVDNFSALRVRTQADYEPGARYLVLCHESHSANAWLVDSLLGWVHKRGYEVRMVTKPSFTAAEVKDSIRAEYNRHNPHLLRWVLLVGEHGQIPPGSYAGVGMSDYWFSDLEPWPSGDNFPEVGISRLSPESPADLENQVKKILLYQQNPPATENWLTKLTMAAHSEDYPGKYSGCIRGIYNMDLPYYACVRDTIMGEYQGNPAVAAAVNSGVGIMIYRGHGDTEEWAGWGTTGSWTNSDVAALANGDLTPVSEHFACNCGEISDATCHAEAWMRKYPGGAASALAATQASYTFPNHGQCSTVVRAVGDTWRISIPGVRDYVGPVFDIAGVMSYMDAYLGKYWPEDPYPDNIYMYLTLGDPAMPIWSGGMPQLADVTHLPTIPLGPFDFEVNVAVAGQPVEGALVCALKPGEFYVADRTNSGGMVTLPVNAGSPGEVTLTISEGHVRHSTPGVPHTPIRPYEAAVLARTLGTPYVTYLRHFINDSPPGGNGDGCVNPGETVIMPTWVKNHGDSAARALSGKLRTSDPFVTVIDSARSFGDIPAHDSAFTGPDGYEFGVAVSCTNGHTIQFNLECRDAHDSVWTSRIYVRVGAPRLAFAGRVVYDTCIGGNRNGRLDPLETAQLVVSLRNVGFGHASGVTAELRSGDARLAVVDSFGAFGDIMVDSVRSNEDDRFMVTTGFIPPETDVPCTLHVAGAGGFEQVIPFVIKVAEVRPCDPIPDSGGPAVVYWAVEDSDTLYSGRPEFEWVEIRGIGTRLTLSDDQTVQVNLPAGFGPFRFYGQSNTQISICGNGWIAPGYTTRSSYENTGLPNPAEPPMLAIVWDDIYPPLGGGVWHYHDAANHRFIVEWDSVAYYSARTTFDKYEVILYDSTRAGPGGNCEFRFQYLTANRYGDCTVGEQDHTKTVAIQAHFLGTGHRGSSPLVPGRAITFTTAVPQVGVSESDLETSRAGGQLELTVVPNPFSRRALIRWQLPGSGPVRVAVYDVTGRMVRLLVAAEMTAGNYSTAWDGKDAMGRSVANGTYLYRLETQAGVRTTKAVLLW